jgi:ABC-2 type transport system ATP-binding protein
MIEIHNVSKHYGTTKAVNDISFTVKSGEILGFLGPNGAGKTTTMKMITCYMPPTSGHIKIDGVDVVENSMAVRRRIGYLPENTPLYDDMGVVEYLQFIADVRKISKDERKGALNRAIDVCGLGDVRHKDIHELSKGFRQRVGLAQAIIHDPDFLVLDEPTSGLDPNQIVEIRKLIRNLGREKTVIFSTHIMQEVQAISDRVLIINDGVIAAQGTLDELKAQENSKQIIFLELLGATQESVKSVFAEFPQLNIVEMSEGKSIKLQLSNDKQDDMRSSIFNSVIKNNWTLLEMRQHQASLEDIFRQLTSTGGMS